ncbi:neo-calmodulin-like [Rhopilema esculentum]|uniref:neo-calmodulin-like n=1 Tax=Rhopilema esculentum TaxID=499914 RepID=UPI0031E0984D
MALASITDYELEEIREMFSLFDTNHDGRITSEELGIVLERLGYIISSESLKALVDEMDYDGSGTIELTEFVRIIEARKETVNIEEAMIEAFRVFDQDQNGFIERRELKNVMKSLGNNLNDKDIDRMMKDADKNGDGRIDFQEFINLWNEHL